MRMHMIFFKSTSSWVFNVKKISLTDLMVRIVDEGRVKKPSPVDSSKNEYRL